MSAPYTIPVTESKAEEDQRHFESAPLDSDTKTADLNDGSDRISQFHSEKPKPESIAHMSDVELLDLQKKMYRKVDLVLLPLVGFLYILNYVDRSGLAATRVYGITTDLDMSATDFSTAIAILFVGYIPMQLPSNLAISRVTRPGLYICIMCIIWGITSTCTAAVKTKEQLYVVRVFLGITEAPFFPGVVYLLSAWYTREYLAKRLASLYMFQALGQALGGFIAAGCLRLDGAHGIQGWRWLFIVTGVATIGFGIFAACVIPEFPHNSKLLKPQERDFAVWRLEAEAGKSEAHDDTSLRKSFALAMKDPKVWTIVWMGSLGQVMGSVFNFFPTIIASLGYSRYNTLLLTVPPYVAAMIGYWIAAFFSDRYTAIYWIAITALCMSFPVYILAMFSPNVAGRYVAMMFMPVTGVVPQIMLAKLVNLHIPRPSTKRAAAIALLNSIGGVSNVWTSYVWFGPPHFYAAFGTLLGAAVAFAVTLTAYRFWVRRLNAKIAGTTEQQESVKRVHGVTDEQIQLGWRYIGF